MCILCHFSWQSKGSHFFISCLLCWIDWRVHVFHHQQFMYKGQQNEDTDVLQELFRPPHAGISSSNPDDVRLLVMVTSLWSTS